MSITELLKPVTTASPPSLTMLILAVLVTYRLSRLFVVEDGPFDCFLRIRILLGVYDYSETGPRIAKTNLGRLFSCPLCLGVWVAFPVTALLFGVNNSTLWVWLAVAGGQSFLESLGR